MRCYDDIVESLWLCKYVRQWVYDCVRILTGFLKQSHINEYISGSGVPNASTQL